MILGIDPAPRDGSLGWALLHAERGEPAVWQAGGTRPVAEARALLAAHPAATLAVETPSGYVWHYERGAALLATAEIAGFLQGLAAAEGRICVTPSAQDWRRVVVGRAAATDDEVREAVRRHVRQLPTRTSVHVRDAAGCALAVGWGWRPPACQIRLPLSYPRRTG